MIGDIWNQFYIRVIFKRIYGGLYRSLSFSIKLMLSLCLTLSEIIDLTVLVSQTF